VGSALPFPDQLAFLQPDAARVAETDPAFNDSFFAGRKLGNFVPGQAETGDAAVKDRSIAKQARYLAADTNPALAVLLFRSGLVVLVGSKKLGSVHDGRGSRDNRQGPVFELRGRVPAADRGQRLDLALALLDGSRLRAVGWFMRLWLAHDAALRLVTTALQYGSAPSLQATNAFAVTRKTYCSKLA
jgi:hypothetical protein